MKQSALLTFDDLSHALYQHAILLLNLLVLLLKQQLPLGVTPNFLGAIGAKQLLHGRLGLIYLLLMPALVLR